MAYLDPGAMNGAVENSGEPHLPCVVLVDTSGSMSPVMDEVHRGLRELGEALNDDPRARGCVELCIVAFDSTVKTVQPFGSVYDYVAPQLVANGTTHMQDAVDLALREIEARKAQYRQSGTRYYRPWIFLLTDGYPTTNNNVHFLSI